MTEFVIVLLLVACASSFVLAFLATIFSE